MTDRPRYPRSSCCVPFCRRTSTLFQSEFVCGEHYRLVDRALKRFRTKRMRVLYRRWEKAKAMRVAYQVRQSYCRAEEDNLTTIAARMSPAAEAELWRLVDVEYRAEKAWHRADNLIWRRMKRQSITRAASTPI